MQIRAFLFLVLLHEHAPNTHLIFKYLQKEKAFDLENIDITNPLLSITDPLTRSEFRRIIKDKMNGQWYRGVTKENELNVFKNPLFETYNYSNKKRKHKFFNKRR